MAGGEVGPPLAKSRDFTLAWISGKPGEVGKVSHFGQLGQLEHVNARHPVAIYTLFSVTLPHSKVRLPVDGILVLGEQCLQHSRRLLRPRASDGHQSLVLHRYSHSWVSFLLFRATLSHPKAIYYSNNGGLTPLNRRISILYFLALASTQIGWVGVILGTSVILDPQPNNSHSGGSVRQKLINSKAP